MNDSLKAILPYSVPSRIESAPPFTFNFETLLRQLTSLSVNTDPIEKLRLSYLITELKDKYPLGSFSLPLREREEKGESKLRAANDRCKEINDLGYGTELCSGTLSSILQVAARKCHNILGDFSFGSYSLASFSNGATTCRSYQKRDPYFKYATSGTPIDVSGRALSRLRALINCTPLWVQHGGADNISVYNYDKVTFVPKNGTEERAIVPQQSGNVCLQKGLARTIRRRLKHAGIDLNDQTANQELARTASISRSHATLDLKNASALMNYRIIWDIIPPDWFRELDALRNTHGKFADGSVIEWNMFSSMGNGYNFELESLLFFVLATAACESLGDYVGKVSVYGDDIIVPLSCYDRVVAVLTAVGFEINLKKTHVDGYFRESCGAHYLKGINFRPFYIKKEVKTLPDLIRICNRIREWSSVDGLLVCDPRYYNLWKSYARQIPRYLYGGRDTKVDYALVTHEYPRYRLQRVVKLQPIHGWRSLLRYWQNQNHTMLLHAPSRDSQLVDVLDTPTHCLASPDDKWFSVKENLVPNVGVALFPQEFGLSDVPLEIRPPSLTNISRRRQKLRDLPHDIQYLVPMAVSMFQME